ncbi:MAG: glycosyltransferase family 4 protein [Candidatus Thiodiazotropha sp.]
MSKIRILQIIHGLHIGGAENVVVSLVRNIDRSQFEVQICCVKETGIMGDRLIGEGVEVTTLPSSKRRLGKLQQLKKAINDYNPDIVHTHGTSALLATGPIYTYSRLPTWLHTFHFGNYPHIAKKYLYGEILLTRFADQLVAVSESQRDSVIKHLHVPENKITTVFNGVEENPFHNDSEVRDSIRSEFGYSKEDIVVGCIAVLSEQKGLTYLLDAVKAVLDSVPRAKFLIVGGGRLQDQLVDKSKMLGIDDVVTFTGWRPDALKIFTGFDIFVQPSLWEGLSMVLLEAISTELPVLVTDVADNSKILSHGENGLIISPKDTKSIEQGLISLCTDKQQAMLMAKRAYSLYLDGFTVDAMVRRYERIYLDLTK